MTIAGQDPPPDPGQAPGRTSAPAWPVIDKPSRGFRAPLVLGSGLAVIAVVFATTFLRLSQVAPHGSAFPGPAATGSPSGGQPSAAPAATAGGPPRSTRSPAVGAVRDVDLTRPPDGVVATDFFRGDGFLVAADPGVVAVAGCEEARSAAVVTAEKRRFMTSSLPEDSTRCHEVALTIDFLLAAPAGPVQVTPLRPGTLTMEIVYRDLARAGPAGLSVSAGQAQAHGGVDLVIIRPATAGVPVAVTRLRYAPLS